MAASGKRTGIPPLRRGTRPVEQLPRRFRAEIRDDPESEGKARVNLTIDGYPPASRCRTTHTTPTATAFTTSSISPMQPSWDGRQSSAGCSSNGQDQDPPSRKRRSDPSSTKSRMAAAQSSIDEAVVAYVWEYAKRHSFMAGVTTVDYQVLKTIKHLTGGLEVAARSAHEWEEAILAGYDVWRHVSAHGGGVIDVDLRDRTSSWSHNPRSEATRWLIPHFGGNQAGTRSARARNRCLMRVRFPTPWTRGERPGRTCRPRRTGSGNRRAEVVVPRGPGSPVPCERIPQPGRRR